jgi:hypothetical protein
MMEGKYYLRPCEDPLVHSFDFNLDRERKASLTLIELPAVAASLFPILWWQRKRFSEFAFLVCSDFLESEAGRTDIVHQNIPQAPPA